MHNKKISKKPGKSLKGNAMAKRYSPGEKTSLVGLKEAITEALFEADFDTFKGCIAILLEKCNYQDITQKTGLSKSSLYRMSEPTSNPTLENIGKILSYINHLHEEEAA
jgi:DNA-binding phage protein